MNLNSYWKSWIQRFSRLISIHSCLMYFSTKHIEWGVLGITRLFYTFHMKQVTSKVGAGEYALLVVPSKWHKIIYESMNYRRGIKKSLYESRIKRKLDVIDYMKFMLSEYKKQFGA